MPSICINYCKKPQILEIYVIIWTVELQFISFQYLIYEYIWIIGICSSKYVTLKIEANCHYAWHEQTSNSSWCDGTKGRCPPQFISQFYKTNWYD